MIDKNLEDSRLIAKAFIGIACVIIAGLMHPWSCIFAFIAGIMAHAVYGKLKS